MRRPIRLHIKAKKYAVHLSDESTRCPFPMNYLCSAYRLTNSGLFVGHSKLIATAVEPSCLASHSIMRSYASSEELHRYRKPPPSGRPAAASLSLRRMLGRMYGRKRWFHGSGFWGGMIAVCGMLCLRKPSLIGLWKSCPYSEVSVTE